MKKMRKYIIITTINKKTVGVKKFEKSNDWNLLVIGDEKSHKIKSSNNLTFFSIEEQNKLGFQFSKKCPLNHYSRKNIGYIYAIQDGANMIFDTDDDNIPYKNWFSSFDIKEYEVIMSPKFVNVYNLFTDKHIWPRGFPLNKIKNQGKIKAKKIQNKQAVIIQGLADRDTDVDAIYRMIDGEFVYFRKGNPVILNNNIYCPFNSQNTLWLKEAFVYLYLPISVSFRFTDILRGYIAQKGIWALEKNLAFISSTVQQKRNKHNLMDDFASEIDCYLKVEKVVEILDALSLSGNPLNDIRNIYTELNKNKIVNSLELEALDAWIKDISNEC